VTRLHSASLCKNGGTDRSPIWVKSEGERWRIDRIRQPVRAGSILGVQSTFFSSQGEFAASRKTAKYVSLAANHLFFSIAVETQRPLNEEARQLLCDLGRRISASSGDDREVIFLFQRVSVVVQRFNSVLLHDSFSVEYQPD